MKDLLNTQITLALSDQTCARIPTSSSAWSGDPNDWRTISFNSMNAYLHTSPPASNPLEVESSIVIDASSSNIQLLSFLNHPLFAAVSPLLPRLPLTSLLMDLTDELTGGTGLISLDAPFGNAPVVSMNMITDGMDVSLSIGNMRIAGLDTIRSSALLDVLSDHVLGSHIAASRLEVTLDMSLQLALPFGMGSLDEVFNVSVGVRDLNASVAALLAIDQGQLYDLQIGSVIDNTAGCLLSLPFAASLTRLRATIEEVINPVLSGFIDSLLSQSIVGLSDALFNLFEPGVLNALPMVLDTTLRQMINEQITALLSTSTCVQSHVPITSNLPHWRNLSIGTLNAYLEAPNPPPSDPLSGEAALGHAHAAGQVWNVLRFDTHPLFVAIMPVLARLPISSLVSALTGGTGILELRQDATAAAALEMPLDTFGYAPLVDVISTVNVSFGMGTLRLSGLDTIATTQLFSVLSPHVIGSHFAASRLDVGVDLSLRVGLPLGLGGLDEQFRVSVGLRDLDVRAAGLFAIRQDDLYNLQLGSLVDTPTSCLASLLYSAALTQLRGNVSDIANPVLSGFVDAIVSQSITAVSDALFGMFEMGVVNKLPHLTDTTVRSLLNEQFTSFLADNTCTRIPGPSVWSGDPDDWRTISFNSVNAYLHQPPPPSNPLAGEASVISHAAGQHVQLLDFQTHPLFTMLAPMLKNLPITQLLTDMTDANGLLVLEQPLGDAPVMSMEMATDGMDVTLSIGSMRIGGLDTVSSDDLLSVLSKHVIGSSVSASHIDLSVSMSLQLGLPFGMGSLNEAFNVSVGLRGIHTTVAAIVALDVTKFDALQIGSVLNSPIGCPIN